MRTHVRGAISLIVAASLAVPLLYFSLRGLEWRQVGVLVAGANAGGLALTAALACLTLFLRALRWRVLLNAEGSVTVPTAFWATSAGYFGNNFLPARAGELVRMHMIARQSSLQHAFVLATAVFERVADAIVLIAISAIVTMTIASQPGWIAGAARTFGAIGLVGVVALAVVPLMEPQVAKLLAAAPLPQSLRRPLLSSVEHGLRGMRTFHHPGRLGAFLTFTVVIWCLDAGGAIVGAGALGLRMPPAAAFLLLAGLGLGSALPSTPGYVGIYQFVAVSVLAPFGFSRTNAVGYIMMAQVLSYVVIGVWGGIGLVRYRKARREKDRAPGMNPADAG
jgi:uncharacterized protein (TIRG00374 family)